MQRHVAETERFSLVVAIAIFALAFTVLGWPWFSGVVTIPYDAKSSFFPQLHFLARSLAEGQSPFWSPHIYAGWPQIADPQSLIFSPFHLLLALFDPVPSFRAADGVAFALLFVGGVGVILFCRERNWHIGGALVAALAFSFGGSNASRIQHIGQVESLAFLPLALWLLLRALERSSWRAGLGAGLFSALIVLGRDQVSLLGLYVLSGFVLWHWLDGAGRWARVVASIKPLAAGAVVSLLITALPVLLSALLAADSNRPEIGYEFAGRGSLHPANLMMLVFADLYGAADPKVDFWGPPSFAWRESFGLTNLYVAQNMGQVYTGALAAVTVLSFGVVRGLAWARDIRFFSVATVLLVLFALGWYSPAFHVMYDALPGVTLFRRPADATFPFCALLAIMTGYLVHRWLTETVPPPRAWQRALEILIAIGLTALALWLAVAVGAVAHAVAPILITFAYVAGAIAALYLARLFGRQGALPAVLLLVLFSVVDLGWNNRPNESTGLSPAHYDALRPDTKNETVALLKEKISAAAAASPDRRPRVELVGVAYHWPNIGFIHGFEHLFGHNPLRLAEFEKATAALDTLAGPDQRQFAPLLSSYRSPLENLFGVRFIAVSVPIEQVDPSLKPGDLLLIAHTPDAYVYENPRALPRVMLNSDWREADFDEMISTGWPDVDPRRTVLLENPPSDMTPSNAGGTARILRYRNTEVVVEADSAAGGFLVLNDIWHPWWSATVDGKPAEILKANVLFRAVAVTPGKHAVRFEFHPFAGAWAELTEKLSAAAR